MSWVAAGQFLDRDSASLEEPHLRKTVISVWCVTDGTAGMQHQAQALAAIMKWDQSPAFSDIVVKPHPILRSLPRLGRWAPNLPLVQNQNSPLAKIAKMKDFPSIMLTCGRRVAGISMALKTRAKRAGANMTTIHLQDPRLDPAFFDMLIVPHHDRVRGNNVIVTKAALNRISQSHITASAKTLPHLWQTAAGPRVVVMIGGNNRRYKISCDMTMHMAQQLTAFATTNNAKLFLVPSRRCPDDVFRNLKTAIPRDHCISKANDQPNPYPGILAMADAVIVTSDSINMASEAASTGKPVLIAYWQPETGRIAQFHQTMSENKHTEPLTRFWPTRPFVPLDESAVVRRQVHELLVR